MDERSDIAGYAPRALRRFAGAVRGSVSVEFVVAIPILLAALVLASEYGRALHARMTLESAVAEAARYLGRSPLLPGEDAFPAETVEIARWLVASRTGAAGLDMPAPALAEAGGRRTVAVAATRLVDVPALGFLADLFGETEGRTREAGESGLLVGAADTILYFGR